MTVPVVMDKYPEHNKIFRGWNICRQIGKNFYAIKVDGKRVSSSQFKNEGDKDAAVAFATKLIEDHPELKDKNIVVREIRIEGFVNFGRCP